MASKKQTGVLKGPDARVEAMIFLKDERYLVAEEYGGLRIWDLEKKREVAKILLFENSYLFSTLASPQVLSKPLQPLGRHLGELLG